MRDPAPDVGSIVLPDGSMGGSEFIMKAKVGDLLLVYFGYTSCPDVCPTTLADLRNALRDLGESANRVQVAFVTIDPNRALADDLTNYIRAFFDEGHALRTADPDVLRSAADAFGADYEVTGREDGLFDVVHTAFLYAVDSDGRILVQWPFGTTPEDMTNDLAYLFDQGV